MGRRVHDGNVVGHHGRRWARCIVRVRGQRVVKRWRRGRRAAAPAAHRARHRARSAPGDGIGAQGPACRRQDAAVQADRTPAAVGQRGARSAAGPGRQPAGRSRLFGRDRSRRALPAHRRRRARRRRAPGRVALCRTGAGDPGGLALGGGAAVAAPAGRAARGARRTRSGARRRRPDGGDARTDRRGPVFRPSAAVVRPVRQRQDHPGAQVRPPAPGSDRGAVRGAGQPRDRPAARSGPASVAAADARPGRTPQLRRALGPEPAAAGARRRRAHARHAGIAGRRRQRRAARAAPHPGQ